jgi:hypothetical protein
VIETVPSLMESLVHLSEPYSILGHLELTIILTNKIPLHARHCYRGHTLLNAGSLKSGAFEPKSFHVRVDQGDFKLVSEIGRPDILYPSRYERRMIFDASPYPPRAEWSDPSNAGHNYWDEKEFMGQYRRGRVTGMAMNEPITLDSLCAVS